MRYKYQAWKKYIRRKVDTVYSTEQDVDGKIDWGWGLSKFKLKSDFN